MLPHSDSSEWSADEALWWRSLVDSPTGVKLMARLTHFRPSLPQPSDNPNFAAQQALFASGYEAAIRELLELRKAPESEVNSQSEAYPNLDDDSKWTQDPKNP